MKSDDRLEQYLELCQRIYERMEREGTWPWKEQLPTNTNDNEHPQE